MTTIREQVKAFHEAFGVPVRYTPVRPADERIRLRVKLITEEYTELMQALGFEVDIELFSKSSGGALLPVDMAKVADGCADLDYVVEGTRLEFGIDGAPVAAEVHRSNMAKIGGPVRGDGKVLKPTGWKSPDIVGELVKQGWRP